MKHRNRHKKQDAKGRPKKPMKVNSAGLKKVIVPLWVKRAVKEYKDVPQHNTYTDRM